MNSQTNSRKKSLLEDRSSFIAITSIGFSALFGCGLFWMIGDYGGYLWWAFLCVIALVTGRVWAACMWYVFKSTYGIGESKDK